MLDANSTRVVRHITSLIQWISGREQLRESQPFLISSFALRDPLEPTSLSRTRSPVVNKLAKLINKLSRLKKWKLDDARICLSLIVYILENKSYNINRTNERSLILFLQSIQKIEHGK